MIITIVRIIISISLVVGIFYEAGIFTGIFALLVTLYIELLNALLKKKGIINSR